MEYPGKFFITVYRVDRTGEFTEHYKLFNTEIREFDVSNNKLVTERLEEWRRELEFQYFPEHKLVLDDGIDWSIIQLADGLEIGFELEMETWR